MYLKNQLLQNGHVIFLILEHASRRTWSIQNTPVGGKGTIGQNTGLGIKTGCSFLFFLKI
jgi:hypothetical protein